MARMDGQLIAVLDGANDPVDVADDEAGIDSLAEQIQSQGNNVDIAGALTIAEEGAFDAIRPRHDCQLGRRDGGAPVIVRVEAEGDAVAVADVAAEPLNLVGVDV